MRKKQQVRARESIQLPDNVTRRDFVAGTLLGVGGSLLTASAPGVIRSAQAQSPTFDALVGSDWTGPGGVGDYSTANGNTHEVINAAHSLRDGHWASLPESLVNTGEVYDLVVVGGGFAGLMSAYQFLQKSNDSVRVLLLDNHSVFGGEAKQNEIEVDGYRLQAPQGSNMCLWPPRGVARVMSEFGFFYHPVWEEIGLPMGDEPDAPTWLEKPAGSDKDLTYAKEHYGPMMIMRDETQQGYFFDDPEGSDTLKMARNPWLSGYEELDWSDDVKKELTHLDQFILEDRDDLEVWLDSMTYADLLNRYVGITRPEIYDFLSPMVASYGTGLGCDAVSALSAKHYFAPGTTTAAEVAAATSESPYFAVSFPGGNTAIARHFVKKMLPGAIEGDATHSDIINGRINFNALDLKNSALRMRLNSTVIDVHHDGDPGSAKQVQVRYMDNQSNEVKGVTAKAVIMAGGQWINKHVVRDAPSELLDAMGTFQHAPMLVVNVAVRHWRFMEKLGITSARWIGQRSWFTSIRAPMSLNGEHMPFDPDKPTVLTFYIPFTEGVSDKGLPYDSQSLIARAQLFAMPYREIETTLRNQLAKTFGPHGFDHERDIAAIIANRWGHAYVIPQKGFYYGLDGEPVPRELIRKGYGRVRFAHSELTGDQLWSTACDEGERAARQVLQFV